MSSASVSPNVVSQGSDITVSVIAFSPFSTITITVNQTGGHATSIFLTDIYGDGSFVFGPFNDPPGAYTMTVTDGTHTVTGVAYTISGTPSYTLTLSASGPGTVDNNPGGNAFNSGTLVTLTAIPNQGASFSGWYEGINFLSSSATYAITMNSNRNIVGLFTQPQTAVVSPNPVTQGNKISVAVTGFLPNHALTLTVVETGGYWMTGPTNGSGAATYSNLGPINDVPGTYHLRVTDNTNTLTVSYAVSAGTTQTFSSLAISNVTKV